MQFLWPTMLLGLLLVPVFVALYARNGQRRRRLAARYGSFGMSTETRPRRFGLRSNVPAGLYLVALTVLMLAGARPQAIVSLPRLQATVLLAFDVSGSMAAPDMEPTRLEAAKRAARGFVTRMPSTVKLGVVSFSDAGFAIQAPTDDQAAVLASIDRLAVQRGTSLGTGITSALNVLFAPARSAELTLSKLNPIPEPTPTSAPPGSYSSATIILFTDGENTQTPEPMAAAQQAANRGIRIHTVGVGSTEGSLIEIEGFTIRSRLDEGLLQQISQLTGGTYHNASGGEDLAPIVKQLVPELVLRSEATELTSLFVGAAVVLLLIGAGLSMLWLNRAP